jgi:hypothetical protein
MAGWQRDELTAPGREELFACGDERVDPLPD